MALLMFTQLLDCGLLLVLGLEVLPLGLYQGWDDDYSFYCKMTIRKSTDLEIVADVEISRGFNEAKCVNCYFEYGVWTETSERSHAEVHVASLLDSEDVSKPPDDPTSVCLAQLSEVLGIGSKCLWSGYPKNGRMIFKLCDTRFELLHFSR
ncbi:hypothetical protein FOZ62_005041 [Perkinsus olseni]|uniref:C2H2-type domain-containing protein n=1 Tax=Perkinsus olseni TaxID=32597 RepID=A0A7J6T698_PEROL|nr:hypothetical protein FOZ62_005041 [Perkinsus olseni]